MVNRAIESAVLAICSVLLFTAMPISSAHAALVTYNYNFNAAGSVGYGTITYDTGAVLPSAAVGEYPIVQVDLNYRGYHYTENNIAYADSNVQAYINSSHELANVDIALYLDDYDATYVEIFIGIDSVELVDGGGRDRYDNISYTPSGAPTPTPSPTSTATPAPSPTGGQCSFMGTSINQGGSVTAYQYDEVDYPDTCASETRTCDNGTLSGSYNFETCDVLGSSTPTPSPTPTPVPTVTPMPTPTPTATPAPTACAFNGQPVNNGSSVTAYLSDNVPNNQTCQSEQRTCSNGTLSGSYAYPACTVAFSMDDDLFPNDQ